MRETIEAKEAAELLGLSEWSVYNLARRRVLPHIKVGRRILFRRASLLDWLDEREQASVQQEPVQTGKVRQLR